MEEFENNRFNVPRGYFENSASAIRNKIEWHEENKLYPQLLSLKNSNCFTTPVNYFETCGCSLELIAYPDLNKNKRKSGFITPGDYFMLNEEKLRSLIEPVDPLQGTAILDSIKKQNNFTVKENYFEEGAKKIALNLNRKEARVRILNPRSVLYFAVAAILIISAGIYTFKYYTEEKSLNDCETIACLDKKEILKSHRIETLENEELYDVVNAAKLEQNLNMKGETGHKKRDSIDDTEEDILDQL
jgi:hypothetical protein